MGAGRRIKSKMSFSDLRFRKITAASASRKDCRGLELEVRTEVPRLLEWSR